MCSSLGCACSKAWLLGQHVDAKAEQHALWSSCTQNELKPLCCPCHACIDSCIIQLNNLGTHTNKSSPCHWCPLPPADCLVRPSRHATTDLIPDPTDRADGD